MKTTKRQWVGKWEKSAIVISASPTRPLSRESFSCGSFRNSSRRPSSYISSSVEGWTVSPRKSRRKSACFSSTMTSTPARARRKPSIMPAGPPPTTQQRQASAKLWAIGRALEPAAGEEVRDRHGRRDQEPVRVAALDHRAHLVAREPAAGLELVAIEGDLLAQRLAEAADHQRGREGPGLRGEVAHLADRHARLLLGLAANRVLDRLAGLDEAGEARIGVRHEAGLAAEKAALAAVHQHDGDGVRARKVLRLAGGAIAAKAGAGEDGRRAAVRAEAVARMPEQQRLGLRQNAELVRRHEALHRDRAQVDGAKGGVLLEGVDRRRVEQRREHRPSVERAEERLLVPRRRALEVGEGQKRGRAGAVRAQDRDVPRDRHGARFRIGAVALDEVAVALGAVAQERVADEAEAGPGGAKR